MSVSKKLLQAAAGSAGGETLDIDNVFSTFLYDGTGSAQNIINGINLGDTIVGSIQFDGYISGQTNDSIVNTTHTFNFGTGDFTCEFWVYFVGSSSANLLDFRPSGSDANSFMLGTYYDGGHKLRFYQGGNNRILDTSTLNTSTWHHVAFVRSSGTTKIYKDGVAVSSTYSDTNNYSSSIFEIGQRSFSNGLALHGKLSNVRVVIGTAVYTSNFTVPTSPLTAISGTEVLIATGDNFNDISSNKIAFTQVGTPTISAESPFTGNTGEGGLVWTKSRETGYSHELIDTERGIKKTLRSNGSDAEGTMSSSAGFSSFNSNGYSIAGQFGTWGSLNVNNEDHVSWTFRKALRFFDCVSWSGNSTAGRTISHSLGSVPGMIIVKRTDSTEDWSVWHRELHTNSSGETTQFIKLNDTAAAFPPSPTSSSSATSDVRSASSTTFTVGDDSRVNVNGASYVAYLFAHNNSDGEFGPDSDQDIIKCGSYTGNGSATGPVIDLGFEPQWVMIKGTGYSDATGGDYRHWYIYDMMRGNPVQDSSSYGGKTIKANESSNESGTNYNPQPTPTGFKLGANRSATNYSGETYIYMAIRRGPLAAPTDATKVFFVDSGTAANNVLSTGFNPDMSIVGRTTGGSKYVGARLTGSSAYLFTDSTAAEASYPGWTWDESNQFKQGMYNANNVSWTWKRAPSYFDVVAYTGTGSAMTVNHNLGVVPEMMWVKKRSATDHWIVYHKGLNGGTDPEDYYVSFTNGGGTPAEANFAIFNDTAPTSSVFSLGNYTEGSGSGITYIAYLFATVAGVSKVGSYTGTGSAQNIDCGFSNGAKFVLLKAATGSGPWILIDSARGISTGGYDPQIEINGTSAQSASANNFNAHSAGFGIATGNPDINSSGTKYIFYAIAT